MWRPCTLARCITAQISLPGRDDGERDSRRSQHQLRKLLRCGPTGPPAPETPYARVGEDGVNYAGPQRPDVPQGPMRVVLFGPQAKVVAQSAAMKAQLAAAEAKGRAWELVPVASDQNWGAASTQLVHALWDEHALAIVALIATRHTSRSNWR